MPCMAAAFRMFFLFPPFYLLFCYLLLYLLQKKKSTANMIKKYGILTFLEVQRMKIMPALTEVKKIA